MYRLPALYSTRPKLWLPPKVWFHGSQSTSTGGSSARMGIDSHICCWFAHHMRCVLMTACGSRVEPDVNRNFTIVSGPVAAIAASTCEVAGVALNSSNAVARRPSSAGRLFAGVTISTSAGTAASIAARYRSARVAKTSPGVIVAITWRSFTKSRLISE